ncbi:hypothetical protein CDD82_7169 [Ophiocordyceps australis]|uniref:Histone acetyltransferase type B catalytic subunit n=1 Tax=Ophiocordyceps australis TaxID=1399860 RepID=A0A2C5YRY1_9HYPO|nr:hypothetical protein CDD82_7169 [Ophiocordyceps australis]
MDAAFDATEWLQDANEALSISLVSPSPSGLKPVGSFHPKFTHTIFDDEKVFGYKKLKINLRFRANDMRPHLHTSYGEKLRLGQGPSEPTDIVAAFNKGSHLPKVAFVKNSDFESSSKQMSDSWTPPGTLHASLDCAHGQFEIWRGSLTDPAVKQLNSRVQIMVPLFIDGGSYIGQDAETGSYDSNPTDADRWTCFFLYHTQKSTQNPDNKSYVFVGYSTVYRWFYFDPPASSARDDWELPKGDFDLSELPCRNRLSQFVILPPFQGKGHGHSLYRSIFDYYYLRSQTKEFTIESPNESFDDLRDVCDLEFLRTVPEFMALKLDTSISTPMPDLIPQLIVSAASLDHVRRKTKIARRQFSRLVEMHLMSQLPESVRPTLDLDAEVPKASKEDEHQLKLWHLVAKQRLYRHNKEALAQIEPSERIEKLGVLVNSIELDYARLLAAFERAVKRRVESNGKRKLSEEPEKPSKKAKKSSDA